MRRPATLALSPGRATVYVPDSTGRGRSARLGRTGNNHFRRAERPRTGEFTFACPPPRPAPAGARLERPRRGSQLRSYCGLRPAPLAFGVTHGLPKTAGPSSGRYRRAMPHPHLAGWEPASPPSCSRCLRTRAPHKGPGARRAGDVGKPSGAFAPHEGAPAPTCTFCGGARSGSPPDNATPPPGPVSSKRTHLVSPPHNAWRFMRSPVPCCVAPTGLHRGRTTEDRVVRFVRRVG